MNVLQDQLSVLGIGGTSRTQNRADAIVLQYLKRWHPGSAATAAFEEQVKLTERHEGDEADLPDLLDLLANHDAVKTKQRQSLAATADARSSLPSLPGPSTLPFHVSATHSSLHTSNILALRCVVLPVRRFNTRPSGGGDPRFEISETPVLCSAGADKRVLFFDAESGDVLESLEPVARTTDSGHTAAILDIAQHPSSPRELVTAGMDGKVILWDLLTREPHTVLRDHTRFVVRCAWSSNGHFLATAAYDKTIHIYQRQQLSTTGPGMEVDDEEEEEDDPLDDELQPLLTSLKLVFTLPTRGNPEAIAFVSHPDDAATPWLVWSMRDDCFLHYLDLGRSIQGGPGAAPVETKYNTNENDTDEHISYSILSIAVHPTLPLLSLVTGSHASQSSCSMILLMPIFSSDRTATLHTTVPSSSTYSPRQAWQGGYGSTPQETAGGVWVTSEEGRLKLYDLQGKERCDVGVHGAASQQELTGMSAEEKAKRWRMGTMNGLIKDV